MRAMSSQLPLCATRVPPKYHDPVHERHPLFVFVYRVPLSRSFSYTDPKIQGLNLLSNHMKTENVILKMCLPVYINGTAHLGNEPI